MIYIERTVTINKGSASIDEQIVLFKGDKNVEILFHIKNNPFKAKRPDGLTATYGQLVINREANPIFSEITQITNNKVLFVVTGDMIDEIVECGYYDFQIRLFNEDKASRVTLPPVEDGILIEKPICEEEGVNASTVNYSRAATGEVLDVFDEDGNYNKTLWANGDLITDSKLNKIEDALDYLVEDANNSEGGGGIDGPITDLEAINSISMGRTGEIGTNSVALGTDCQANNYTSAIGYGLIANASTMRRGQCVVGRYNEEDTSALFVVGNGMSDSARKNAFVVDNHEIIMNEDVIFNNSITSGHITADSIRIQNLSGEGDISFIYIDKDGILISPKDPIRDEHGTSIPDHEDYFVATKGDVNDAIANIELTPGPQGEPGPQGPQGPAGKDADPVDLEGYATEEYVNNILGNIETLLGGI